MQTNPTIDGVSRELLQNLLHCGDTATTITPFVTARLREILDRQPVTLARQRKMRIYIAGPMTGIEDYNFPAFNAMAAQLRSVGWHVENPAEHGIVDGADWADYLRYDISRLSTCEAMMLLRGWSASKGAQLEVSIAKKIGIVVMFADDAEDYTAPPAPVAVVIDEQQAFANWTHEVIGTRGLTKVQRRDEMTADQEKYAMKGWLARACLDATAALNTVHVGELDPAQRLAMARGETK